MLGTDSTNGEGAGGSITGPASRATPDLSELTEAVVAAAQGLRFGSIEIVVHDARIVQVVRTEKRRLIR